jgi:hypothetical protein
LKSSAWHLKSSDETIGKLLEKNRKAPLFATEGSGGFIGAFRQEKSLCPFFKTQGSDNLTERLRLVGLFLIRVVR